MTYLWQEERGNVYYRAQTDEKDIADKLKRRKGFTLAGIPMNEKSIWIFTCQFTRPDIAKKVLKSVTGKNAKIDSEGVIFYE